MTILDKKDVDVIKLTNELNKLSNLASHIQGEIDNVEFVIQISIPLFISLWEDNWHEQFIAAQEFKSVEYPRFDGIKVVPVSYWFDNKIHLLITKKSEYPV